MAWLISPIPQQKKKQAVSRSDQQDPVVTHRVKYADVELEMSWGEKVVYNAPVLVDIPEHKDVQQERVHMALTPFDTEDLAQPQKNEAKTESFASRQVFSPLAADCTVSKVCGG